MGMQRRQMLWRIQLPLAWPVLLAGLRVVTVQSIGLAAVAALIGAGGLGHFVFLGLGQGANDLVLLGTRGDHRAGAGRRRAVPPPARPDGTTRMIEFETVSKRYGDTT